MIFSNLLLLGALLASSSAKDVTICDQASAFVANQYERYRELSDEELLSITGHPRLYFEIVAGQDEITPSQIEVLLSDRVLQRSVMASLSLAGRRDRVSRLIKAGISPNIPSDDGVPPLVVASACNRGGVVEVLLNGGAEMDMHDRQGLDAMAVAITEDHEGIVNLLVMRGYQVHGCTHAKDITRRLAASLHDGKYRYLLKGRAVGSE